MRYENYIDIFVDASISDPKRNQQMTPVNVACSGCLVISKYGTYYDEKLLCEPPKEFSYVVQNYDENLMGNVTNNVAEATAMLLGFQNVLKMKLLHPEIQYANIYSDSNLCVKSLREWIHKWFNNIQVDEYGVPKLIKPSDHLEVLNQHIYLECVKVALQAKTPINLLHVCGHTTNTPQSMKKTYTDFIKSNGIHGTISTDFLKYLISNNDIVDRRTRLSIFHFMNYHKIPYAKGMFGIYEVDDLADLYQTDPTSASRNIPMIQPVISKGEQITYRNLVNDTNHNPCTIWERD